MRCNIFDAVSGNRHIVVGSCEATAGADAARAGTERGEVNARTGKITALHTEKPGRRGPAYEKFLSEALPLFGPTRKIGWLVTSRLEKYRTTRKHGSKSTTSNTTS
ncbi:hypothetical protein ACWTU6_18610 [Mesorhizobium sp. BHbsci]